MLLYVYPPNEDDLHGYDLNLADGIHRVRDRDEGAAGAERQVEREPRLRLVQLVFGEERVRKWRLAQVEHLPQPGRPAGTAGGRRQPAGSRVFRYQSMVARSPSSRA